jgi:hypothetical protein
MAVLQSRLGWSALCHRTSVFGAGLILVFDAIYGGAATYQPYQRLICMLGVGTLVAWHVTVFELDVHLALAPSLDRRLVDLLSDFATRLNFSSASL